MSDKIVLLGGVLRFNPWGMVICAVFLAAYFAHWASNIRKTGWGLDYWHFTIFFIVVVPVLLMYPVSGSIYQALAIGDRNFAILDSWIETALGVSLVGFLGLLGGRELFDWIGPSRSAGIVNSVWGPFARMFHRNIMSGACQVVLVALSLLAASVVFSAVGLDGLAKIRDFFLKNESIRPFYNLLLSVYPLLPLYYWLRSMEARGAVRLGIFIPLLIAVAVLGSRGAFIAVAFLIYAISIFRKGGRLSVFRMVLVLIGLMLFAILLDAMRSGGDLYGGLISIWSSIFFGNNLSDLRDFAWLISVWDGTPFLGKTYAAALMGFLPRFVSDFRENWAFGVVSATMAGLSPQSHAGLRPGVFGEAYFNFGLIGVLVLGLVNGFLLRYGDWEIKRLWASGGGPAAMYVATVPYQVGAAFFLTSGFWGIYLLFIVHICAACLRRMVVHERIRAGLGSGRL